MTFSWMHLLEIVGHGLCAIVIGGAVGGLAIYSLATWRLRRKIRKIEPGVQRLSVQRQKNGLLLVGFCRHCHCVGCTGDCHIKVPRAKNGRSS